jgi:hypothetical protein
MNKYKDFVISKLHNFTQILINVTVTKRRDKIRTTNTSTLFTILKTEKLFPISRKILSKY